MNVIATKMVSPGKRIMSGWVYSTVSSTKHCALLTSRAAKGGQNTHSALVLASGATQQMQHAKLSSGGTLTCAIEASVVLPAEVGRQRYCIRVHASSARS